MTARGTLTTVQMALTTLSLGLVVTGTLFADRYITLAAVLALFVANLMYICSDLRSRSLLLMLHLGIFLFWLTRPVLGLAIWHSNSWEGTWGSTFFALRVVYVTMIVLWAVDALMTSGEQFCAKARRHELWIPGCDSPCAEAASNQAASDDGRRLHRRRRLVAHPVLDDPTLRRAVQLVSLTLFLVSVVCALAAGVQALKYMSGRTYTEYFLVDSSAYASSGLSSIGNLTPYALCAYLATLPRKKPSVAALLLYIVTTVPYLMIGTRGSFVIAVLLLLFYYLLRHFTDGTERWFGRFEILLLAVVIPAGILAMGQIDYLRSSKGGETAGTLVQIADSLFKQGVTFKTLEYGYEVNPQVQALGFKFFSGGSLVYAVTQGFIGQQLLGLPLWPTYNSVGLALEGSYYSHTMSFFAHPGYLAGSGYGSAYVLELYADFGWTGVVAGSALIAVAFRLFARGFGRSWFLNVVVLMAGRMAFHMPRGEFAEWASFLWSTRFWMAIALIIVCAYTLRAVAARGWLPALPSLKHVDGAERVSTCLLPALSAGQKGEKRIALKGREASSSRRAGMVPLVGPDRASSARDRDLNVPTITMLNSQHR